MSAIDLIVIERQRQIEKEGRTTEHDDLHQSDELARVAACYAMPIFYRTRIFLSTYWPWHYSWWKPTPDDRIRELVKAGALIVAEIERLQRSRTIQGEE